MIFLIFCQLVIILSFVQVINLLFCYFVCRIYTTNIDTMFGIRSSPPPITKNANTRSGGSSSANNRKAIDTYIQMLQNLNLSDFSDSKFNNVRKLTLDFAKADREFDHMLNSKLTNADIKEESKKRKVIPYGRAWADFLKKYSLDASHVWFTASQPPFINTPGDCIATKALGEPKYSSLARSSKDTSANEIQGEEKGSDLDDDVEDIAKKNAETLAAEVHSNLSVKSTSTGVNNKIDEQHLVNPITSEGIANIIDPVQMAAAQKAFTPNIDPNDFLKSLSQSGSQTVQSNFNAQIGMLPVQQPPPNAHNFIQQQNQVTMQQSQQFTLNQQMTQPQSLQVSQQQNQQIPQQQNQQINQQQNQQILPNQQLNNQMLANPQQQSVPGCQLNQQTQQLPLNQQQLPTPSQNFNHQQISLSDQQSSSSQPLGQHQTPTQTITNQLPNQFQCQQVNQPMMPNHQQTASNQQQQSNPFQPKPRLPIDTGFGGKSLSEPTFSGPDLNCGGLYNDKPKPRGIMQGGGRVKRKKSNTDCGLGSSDDELFEESGGSKKPEPITMAALSELFQGKLDNQALVFTEKLQHEINPLKTKIENMDQAMGRIAQTAVNTAFNESVKPQMEQMEKQVKTMQNDLNSFKEASSTGSISLGCNKSEAFRYNEYDRRRRMYLKSVENVRNEANILFHLNEEYMISENGRNKPNHEKIKTFIGCKYQVIGTWSIGKRLALEVKLMPIPNQNMEEIALKIVENRKNSNGLGINFKTPISHNCDAVFADWKRSGCIQKYTTTVQGKYLIIVNDQIKIYVGCPIEISKFSPGESDDSKEKFINDMTKLSQHWLFFPSDGIVYDVPKVISARLKERLRSHNDDSRDSTDSNNQRQTHENRSRNPNFIQRNYTGDSFREMSSFQQVSGQNNFVGGSTPSGGSNNNFINNFSAGGSNTPINQKQFSFDGNRYDNTGGKNYSNKNMGYNNYGWNNNGANSDGGWGKSSSINRG